MTALPEVHEEPAAGICRIDSPISADLFSLKLVARLRQPQVYARHAPDGARVDDRLDVYKLGEIPPIVPAATPQGQEAGDWIVGKKIRSDGQRAVMAVVNNPAAV